VENDGSKAVAISAPSAKTSIFWTPEGASVADPPMEMVLEITWPSVAPATDAAPGSSVSTPNEPLMDPGLPPRSFTVAVKWCRPSLTSTAGVNCSVFVAPPGVTATSSKVRPLVFGSTPLRESVKDTTISGRLTLSQDPGGGAASDSTGGTVSSVLNPLPNATVCVLPLVSMAPLTVTL
jgi:hypothetical protein